MGIDPGTLIMGYGILKVSNKELCLISAGAIELNKIKDTHLKLKTIFDSVIKLIDTHHPDELAIEAPFFGKNVQSMLKLGRAQGVAIAAALSRELSIAEYAPKKIKQSITGNGNASKEQVAEMLARILNVKFQQKHLDASDGVAAALCHHFQGNTNGSNKKNTNWSSFIKQNPEKLIS